MEQYTYLDQKSGSEEENTKNRLENNKMARKMIKEIEENCEEYPSIILSFKRQLIKDRTISEKQFGILVKNLPKT
jgi:hypothetical protein